MFLFVNFVFCEVCSCTLLRSIWLEVYYEGTTTMTLFDYFKSYYDIISQGQIENLDDFYCSDSPFLIPNKQRFENLRAKLEFSLQVHSIELLSQQDDLLIVRDEVDCTGEQAGQSITKRSTNLHALVKDGGEWKIHTSSILPN